MYGYAAEGGAHALSHRIRGVCRRQGQAHLQMATLQRLLLLLLRAGELQIMATRAPGGRGAGVGRQPEPLVHVCTYVCTCVRCV